MSSHPEMLIPRATWEQLAEDFDTYDQYPTPGPHGGTCVAVGGGLSDLIRFVEAVSASNPEDSHALCDALADSVARDDAGGVFYFRYVGVEPGDACPETTDGRHVIFEWITVPAQRWGSDSGRGYDAHERGVCEACAQLITR